MKRTVKFLGFGLAVLAVILLAGCEETYAPKEKGYFRIDLPRKTYTLFDSACPYRFMYPVYAKVSPYSGAQKGNCWLNVDFPGMQARIHLSYDKLNNDLPKHLEDSRMLAYKHIVKAEAINEEVINRPGDKVYGLIYNIDGSTASNFQFYLTDSTKHFLRGALYFNVKTNIDSLQPVLEFIRADGYKLIESFGWKE